jgi:putative Ca2+/H+ antiporter (TMEM165/GDT1 family)
VGFSLWDTPGMEALLVSFGTATIAEIGDRTQLLSLLLVARYGRPWSVLAGVLVASFANHALAGLVGLSFGRLLGPRQLEVAVGLGMIVMAFWTWCGDQQEETEKTSVPRRQVFIATVVAFFIAEIGDKTQIATVALVAAYSTLLLVVAGTTCGMLAANFPVIFLGNAFAPRLPLKTIRLAASLLFVVIGFVFLGRAFPAIVP